MTGRPGIRLTDRQRFDWVRLSRVEGVGPRTFQGLVNRFGGAGAAIEALPDLAAQRGRRVHVPPRAEIEAEFARAARLGAAFFCSGEAGYPARLYEIDAPPPVIAVRGDPGLLDRSSVAIVGARNASAAGRRMAGRLAAGLGAAGFAVISGLARGIDAEAHRASLATGTIAVLAGGLDRPYPPENEELCAQIAASGACVSEMPFGFSPRGRDFPRRNRLVSGLSLGVIVVEAARRSGSLITARMANEQGREVFAVPGSPLDPRSEGSNDLLREGASIVTSAEDVIGILAPLAGAAGRAPRLFREKPDEGERPLYDEIDPADGIPAPAMADDEESGRVGACSETPQLLLLGLVSFEPVEVDVLVRLSGLDPRAVQAALVELELAGAVSRVGAGRVVRRVQA